jgi:hypothetical protein
MTGDRQECRRSPSTGADVEGLVAVDFWHRLGLSTLPVGVARHAPISVRELELRRNSASGTSLIWASRAEGSVWADCSGRGRR